MITAPQTSSVTGPCHSISSKIVLAGLFVLMLQSMLLVQVYFASSPNDEFGPEDLPGHAVLLRRARMYESEVERQDRQEHKVPLSVNSKGPFLTIFTVLKELTVPAPDSPNIVANPANFVDWVDLRTTKNAILTWALLPVDLLLFGDHATCHYVQEVILGSLPAEQRMHIHCEPPPCIDVEYKAPTYDCIFAKAKELARTPFIMYTNSDMIYFQEIIDVTLEISRRFPNFAIVGKRVDIRIPLGLSFGNTSEWANELRQIAKSHGVLHGKYGIDYFIFNRDSFPNMLPFLVGRVRWDNWLLAQCIRRADITTIDATEAILALHQNHGKVGASAKRPGSSYNINLTLSDVVDPKKIGDIEQTDVRIVSTSKILINGPSNTLYDDPHPSFFTRLDVSTGNCAEGHCFLKRTVPSLEAIVFKRHHNRVIIVASVGQHDIDLAVNWACHLERASLPYYMFHAADAIVLAKLQALKLPVYMLTSSYGAMFATGKLSSTPVNKTTLWRSTAFEAQVNGKIELIAMIIMLNFDVLMLDINAVVMGNPIPLMESSVHLIGKSQSSSKELSTGFMFLRACEAIRQYIFRVKNIHDRLIDAALKPGPDGKLVTVLSSSLQDKAFNQGIVKEYMKVGIISRKLVADHDIFHQGKELKPGEWPLVIHHSTLSSYNSLVDHLKDSALWLLNDSRQCRPGAFPRVIHPPAREAADGISSAGVSLGLFIRVIQKHNLLATQFLLDSLLQAEYIEHHEPNKQGVLEPNSLGLTIGWLQVNVRIAIVEDHPDLTEIKSALIQFKKSWKRGKVDMIETLATEVSPDFYWTNQWLPNGHRELGLFLEPSLRVTPKFASTLLLLADRYYFGTPEKLFDHRLYGISLLSEIHDIPFFKHNATQLLNSTAVYRYQKFTKFGTAIFSTHYSEFLVWYFQQAETPEFFPSIMNVSTGPLNEMISWFDRFIAERGWYSLFPTSELGHIIYKPKKGLQEVVRDNRSLIRHLRPLNEVIFLDMHSNKLLPQQVIEGRALFYDAHGHHSQSEPASVLIQTK